MFSKLFKNFKVNKVVAYFVFADLALFSGWGLVSPIFSIFVTREIVGATLITVGTGASVYWLSKSFMQLPIGAFLDKAQSERRSLYTLILGLVLAALSAFAFVFIKTIPQFYMAQLLHAVGMALYVPAWNSIFSHHLDKNKVAFEWAVNSSSLGLASGVTGFLGGYVSNYFGFQYVFMAAGVLSLLSAIIIFVVPEILIPHRTPYNPHFPKDHTPKTVTH